MANEGLPLRLGFPMIVDGREVTLTKVIPGDKKYHWNIEFSAVDTQEVTVKGDATYYGGDE